MAYMRNDSETYLVCADQGAGDVQYSLKAMKIIAKSSVNMKDSSHHKILDCGAVCGT